MRTVLLRFERLAPLACLGLAAACSGASGTFPELHEEPGGSSSSSTTSTASSTTSATTPASSTAAFGPDASDASDATTTPDVATGPNPCPQGLAVCDDFEETQVGQPPRQALWTIGAPDCGPMRGTATVDATQAHSGRHSVKVVNDFGNASPPGYCDHVFFNNTSAFGGNGGSGNQAIQGNQVYGRFYVYLQNPVAGMNHTTFATFADKANGGEQIRIGFSSDVFVWNRTAGGGALYLPELDTGNAMINTQASVQPTSGSWVCVEFHVDESAGGLDTWVDGTEVPGLMVQDNMPVTDVSTQWLGGGNQPPQLTSFGLGWETYNLPNAAADAQTLWFDDVALADHKIGCTN